MNTHTSPPPLLDLGLALFSAAGILACLGLGFVASMLAIGSFLQGDREAAVVLEWAAFALGFMGLCGIPALYWSSRVMLTGEVPPAARPSQRWAWIAALLPLSLALGAAAARSQELSALFGPVAQVVSASIPVAVVILLVRRIGPPARPQLVWGQFLLGLWLTPVTAATFELVLLLPLAAVALLGLALSPAGKALLEALANNPTASPESLVDQFASVFGEPWAIALALFYTALLVPVVEECLKTMGIWPVLFGNRPSPGEGFLSGVLVGAGFALAEALFMLQPGMLWLAGIVMRVAGTIVHSLTGGLSCWGAAETVLRRSPWPFVRRFAAAVLLHGTWNAAIVLIWATALAFEAELPWASYPLASSITAGSSIALSLLMVVSVIGLPWAARRSMRPIASDAQRC